MSIREGTEVRGGVSQNIGWATTHFFVNLLCDYAVRWVKLRLIKASPILTSCSLTIKDNKQ